MQEFVLAAARLIDGSGELIAEPRVHVREGRVVAVYQGQAPDSVTAPVVSYPLGTILPGLMDCHVHLDLPGDGTPFPDLMREPDNILMVIATANARTALESGITTLRDCGGRGTTTFDLRRALRLGFAAGPRLVLCGQPITITGGHCHYFGGEADGVEGVRRKVREMTKMGADFIKVMGTGGGTPNTISWLPSYSREEVAALTDEAHRMGRPISIHCLCADAIRYAADAGADQIEHASFIVDDAGNQRYDAEAAQRLAASGAYVTGTLAVGYYVVERLSTLEHRTAAEQDTLDRWRVMLEDNLQQFQQLLQEGIRFVAGTDAGWRFTPFNSLPVEMELMRQGGMSSMEAIVAATGRAAQALRVQDEAGTARPGLTADLLVVAGDPLQDLGVLRQPELVLQGGRVIGGAKRIGY